MSIDSEGNVEVDMEALPESRPQADMKEDGYACGAHGSAFGSMRFMNVTKSSAQAHLTMASPVVGHFPSFLGIFAPDLRA
ncbi:hypothetical protein LMG29542_04975 [Paraburkholderia humisilvae]|uniref:Uncharacterized protein n=1 Tax=Paraburkholderia humisilvae TaxID=627669 RepID=A0A6J5EGH6_9BURK|nr:hypothetical protein LMG29542_04975 [Paraburkholderia humisilvae]